MCPSAWQRNAPSGRSSPPSQAGLPQLEPSWGPCHPLTSLSAGQAGAERAEGPPEAARPVPGPLFSLWVVQGLHHPRKSGVWVCTAAVGSSGTGSGPGALPRLPLSAGLPGPLVQTPLPAPCREALALRPEADRWPLRLQCPLLLPLPQDAPYVQHHLIPHSPGLRGGPAGCVSPCLDQPPVLHWP